MQTTIYFTIIIRCHSHGKIFEGERDSTKKIIPPKVSEYYQVTLSFVKLLLIEEKYTMQEKITLRDKLFCNSVQLRFSKFCFVQKVSFSGVFFSSRLIVQSA